MIHIPSDNKKPFLRIISNIVVSLLNELLGAGLDLTLEDRIKLLILLREVGSNTLFIVDGNLRRNFRLGFVHLYTFLLDNNEKMFE